MVHISQGQLISSGFWASPQWPVRGEEIECRSCFPGITPPPLCTLLVTTYPDKAKLIHYDSRSDFAFQRLKFLVLTKAFRKSYAILCQTSESVRKWDCVTWVWEWFLSDLVNWSDFASQCLKFLVSAKAFRKTYAIVCQTSESVRKWECVT